MEVILSQPWIPDVGERPDYREARLWMRRVSRDYPRVPIAGEILAIDDAGECRRVLRRVIWHNSGAPILTLEPVLAHDTPNFDEAQLEAWGFLCDVDAALTPPRF